MQYWTCPCCNSNLDPGEKCDCQEQREAAQLAPGTASGSAGRSGHHHKLSVPRFSGSVKEGFAYG